MSEIVKSKSKPRWTSERSRHTTTSLQARVRRLEDASGGGECPRCSGTTVVYVNGELEGISKDGRKFTPEEAKAFESEEESGRCPKCGAKRGPEIRIGWPVGS